MQRRLGRTGQTNGNDSEARPMQKDERGREKIRGPPGGGGRGRKGTAACKGEGGELREARMPSRGMRVRRKRGEQLLSCQREPLNLPADLLTIVPASYHHALSPFSCVPSPCVRLLSPSLAASFCSSAPNTTISLSREEDFVERRSAIDGM